MRDNESWSVRTLTDVSSDDGFVFSHVEFFPPIDKGFHVVEHVTIPEIVSFHSSDEGVIDDVYEFTAKGDVHHDGSSIEEDVVVSFPEV
jgi:hypothetical protein